MQKKKNQMVLKVFLILRKGKINLLRFSKLRYKG